MRVLWIVLCMVSFPPLEGASDIVDNTFGDGGLFTLNPSHSHPIDLNGKQKTDKQVADILSRTSAHENYILLVAGNKLTNLPKFNHNVMLSELDVSFNKLEDIKESDFFYDKTDPNKGIPIHFVLNLRKNPSLKNLRIPEEIFRKTSMFVVDDKILGSMRLDLNDFILGMGRSLVLDFDQQWPSQVLRQMQHPVRDLTLIDLPADISQELVQWCTDSRNKVWLHSLGLHFPDLAPKTAFQLGQDLAGYQKENGEFYCDTSFGEDSY